MWSATLLGLQALQQLEEAVDEVRILSKDGGRKRREADYRDQKPREHVGTKRTKTLHTNQKSTQPKWLVYIASETKDKLSWR